MNSGDGNSFRLHYVTAETAMSVSCGKTYFCFFIIATVCMIFPRSSLEKEGISKEQKYKKYDSRFIKKVHWSMTGRCNYKCRHCLISAPHAKLGELSHDECMKIIRELASCGIRQLSVTGGEPLARADFLNSLMK